MANLTELPAFFRRRPSRNGLSAALRAGRFLLCLGLASQGGWGQPARAADDPGAPEIVDRVARMFTGGRSCTATIEMQIVRQDWQRAIEIQLWSRGESDILVRIRRPAEDDGTAILKSAGKVWSYLPKSNRTVEMPASMMMTSLMGGHFTLNDLVNQGRLTRDYGIATSFEGERDGTAVVEYTLTPKPEAAVVWGRIALEIRKSDLMPLWERYYDEDGVLVRELSFSDYRTVNGRLIPTRLVMQPADRADERTTITYEDIAFDAPIADETFSPGALPR